MHRIYTPYSRLEGYPGSNPGGSTIFFLNVLPLFSLDGIDIRLKRGRGENGKHKALKMPTAVGSSPTVRTT